MSTGGIPTRTEPVRTFDNGRQLAITRDDERGWMVVERSGPREEWHKLAGSFEHKRDARDWIRAQ